MIIIEPINTSDEGTSHCIKADYYKMGLTNFMREIWGGKETDLSQPE